jgi:hypothetical protein
VPNGYNLDSGGKNNIMHPDTKAKLSKAHMGKKRGPHSEEHKKNLSKAHTGKKYGPMSEERKLKISIANSGENNPNFGRRPSENTLRAVSEANKGNKYWVGRKHKQESKNKISESRMGKFNGQANPFFGKTHSKEALDKMSKANEHKKTKVLCINNGIIYDSINAAYKALGVDRSQIRDIINGKTLSAKGFVFKKA